MTKPTHTPLLRIGELSRRVGLSTHVLRAWESRYGLLRPERTPGGYRLYSDADEARVRQMQTLLAEGLSAGQAAEVVQAPAVRSSIGPPAPDRAGALRRGLRAALDARQDELAQRRLDESVHQLGLEATISDVVLPFLRELGERWARGGITIAEEHFASNVIRTRLTGYARGWGTGQGPLAVLACPQAELHDLALLAFGLVLRRCGWRIHYLGARTPVADLAAFAGDPSTRIVLAATTAAAFDDELDALRQLAAVAPVALAGAGASRDLARRIGAHVRLLPPDLLAAAEELTAGQPGAAAQNR